MHSKCGLLAVAKASTAQVSCDSILSTSGLVFITFGPETTAVTRCLTQTGPGNIWYKHVIDTLASHGLVCETLPHSRVSVDTASLCPSIRVSFTMTQIHQMCHVQVKDERYMRDVSGCLIHTQVPRAMSGRVPWGQ